MNDDKTLVQSTTPPRKYQRLVSPDLLEQLRVRFTYHSPLPDQPPRYAHLRGQALMLAEDIVYLIPPGREQALALTKLEEAIFWANAAIARNER